jgi:hypothetical protein
MIIKLVSLSLDKNAHRGQVPVANTCNPSYSGGREQEDHSWRLAQANISQDTTSKITLKGKGLVEWLEV